MSEFHTPDHVPEAFLNPQIVELGAGSYKRLYKDGVVGWRAANGLVVTHFVDDTIHSENKYDLPEMRNIIRPAE